MNYPILDNLDSKLLICSDLQGNLADFLAVIRRFKEFKNQGLCDYLVFAGDLIHSYAKESDQSLEILKRLFLDSELRDLGIICLLGNHELAHLMHWPIKKRGYLFFEKFENELRGFGRRFILEKFLKFPLMIRTRGGVLINHTGPSASLAGFVNEKTSLLLKLVKPLDWFFELNWHKECQNYLDAFNEEFGKLWLLSPEGQLLWEIFFNKNEFSFNENYLEITKAYLKLFECDYLVSMHIEAKKGFQIVNPLQLRLCSSYGAENNLSKKLLLLDGSKKYSSLDDLALGLVGLY